jgi:membrane-associated phospholipid phosphatase
MSPEREPFWRWPSAEMWRWTFVVGARFSLWFALIYAGAWYITDLRTLRVPVHMEWEQNIPFWPASVIVYESMLIIFATPPFILRTPRELQSLGLTLSVVVLIAGIGFLLFPAESGYAPIPEDLGIWTWPVQTAMTLNLRTYNMAPSLHVALSVTCVAANANHARATGKTLLWLWALAIALSTLLLHQHHVVDVVTGWLLGWLGKRFIHDRWSQAPTETSPPSLAADPGRSA